MFAFLGEGKMSSDSIEKYAIKCLFLKEQCNQKAVQLGTNSEARGVKPPPSATCGPAPAPGPTSEESLDLTSCPLKAPRNGWLKEDLSPMPPRWKRCSLFSFPGRWAKVFFWLAALALFNCWHLWGWSPPRPLLWAQQETQEL